MIRMFLSALAATFHVNQKTVHLNNLYHTSSSCLLVGPSCLSIGEDESAAAGLRLLGDGFAGFDFLGLASELLADFIEIEFLCYSHHRIVFCVTLKFSILIA